MPDLTLQWRKAAACHANGSCVEVAPAEGGVAVRDSTVPSGAVLRFDRPQWQRFVQSARRDRG